MIGHEINGWRWKVDCWDNDEKTRKQIVYVLILNTNINRKAVGRKIIW